MPKSSPEKSSAGPNRRRNHYGPAGAPRRAARPDPSARLVAAAENLWRIELLPRAISRYDGRLDRLLARGARRGHLPHSAATTFCALLPHGVCKYVAAGRISQTDDAVVAQAVELLCVSARGVGALLDRGDENAAPEIGQNIFGGSLQCSNLIQVDAAVGIEVARADSRILQPDDGERRLEVCAAARRQALLQRHDGFFERGQATTIDL